MDTFLFQVKLDGVKQNFDHEWQADVHQGRARPLISGTLDIVSILGCEILSFLKKKKKRVQVQSFYSGVVRIVFVSFLLAFKIKRCK